jgi:hypothetical protein
VCSVKGDFLYNDALGHGTKIHFLQNNPKKFRKFLVGLEIPGHGFFILYGKGRKIKAKAEKLRLRQSISKIA